MDSILAPAGGCVGRPRLVRSKGLFKRVRQLAYLAAHPLSHYRCARAIRRSSLTADPLIALRYLGDHLALSMQTQQRREALMGHYAALPRILRPAAKRGLSKGVPIWRRDIPDTESALSIVLELSRLAPMEGELELRFTFKSDLYVLTFLIAPGRAFDLQCGRVLFIGGVQGRIGTREEIREASKLNGEVSPATMLLMTVQALAKAARVDQLIAIGEDEHISMGYSPSKILFDYRRCWTEIGGKRIGRHYSIPLESPQKPLSDIPLSHRRRAKIRRETKRLLSETIECSLRQIIRPPLIIAEKPAPSELVAIEACA